MAFDSVTLAPVDVFLALGVVIPLSSKVLAEQRRAMLIHQRLGHAGFDKLLETRRHQGAEGNPAPSTCPKRAILICLEAKARALAHGKTRRSTDHLLPGSQLHKDLGFVNEVSGFLSVIDAKARHLWTFATRNKRPPLDVCQFIYCWLARRGPIVMVIRVDADISLSHSSEFCEFRYALGIEVDDTGGLASYYNGKVDQQSEHLSQTTSCLVLGHFLLLCTT